MIKGYFMEHIGTKELKTERLLLRKIFPNDADMVYKWMSDPEVLKYEDWDIHENIDFTKGFISWITDDYKTEKTYLWGIQLENELIGFALVGNVNEWDGILAYYLRRDCWSKGYATEAANGIIDFMFTKVGIGRISAKHCIKNPASGKVLQKVNMKYKGHVKELEYYSSKSQWHDFDFYAITRDDYISQNGIKK
jgi:ribosomal-protein-alanine N-acetyltransferase